MKIVGLSMPPSFFQFLKFPNRSDEIKKKILKLIKFNPWIVDLYRQSSVVSTVSFPDDLANFLEGFGKFRSEVVRLALIFDKIENEKDLNPDAVEEESEP